MPTLMNVPESFETGCTTTNNDGNGAEGDDSSEILGDESTIVDENYCPRTILGSTSIKREVAQGGDIPFPRSRERNNDKSVTFDDSFLLISIGNQKHHSQQDSLNSDVSLSMSYHSTPSIRKKSDNYRHDHKKNEGYSHNDRVRPWPNRDEYIEKYQTYVKTTISTFESNLPGKLRNYRSMSSEEKEREQRNVMALLTRLGVSKTNNGGRDKSIARSLAQNIKKDISSPVSMICRERLLDETLSPLFSPQHSGGHDKLSLENSHFSNNTERNLDTSFKPSSKSNLLLSMDDDDGFKSDSEMCPDQRNNDPPACSSYRAESTDNDFEFPTNDDGYNNDSRNDSNCSIELVRRDAEHPDYSNEEASYMTPEGKKSDEHFSKKRVATSSGKRGADLQRSRYNYEEDSYHEDLTDRLGRLSISPSSVPSPPKDFFVTSQSPISPRLTYQSSDESDGDDAFSNQDQGKEKLIGWGRDSSDGRNYGRRESNITVDTLATNSPPARYRDKKEKRRAFREVPVNVSLKQGATFHLEKIPVKREQHVSSKSARLNSCSTKPLQRRKLVNFPDPLVRYGSRSRRVLKEMYSWIRDAEREYEEGDCGVQAVGVLFSLSYQQIIDVSLKLLLHDYAEMSQFPASQQNIRSASMKGNTLVVVRSKDDTYTWESALREGTGCSVLNHSTLPLSERIRAVTSEKACLHDVVLTTYDAMKSPDVTIPITKDGHAILTKPGKDNSWHTSRSASQHKVASHQQTKQLSVLHRITFKRVIFIDMLGRKCYLAKSGTARASASVALSNSVSRYVFFEESEADGSNAILALRKSDKRAYQSVSSALHLEDEIDGSDIDESSCDEEKEETLESVSMDFRNLC